MRNSAGIAVSEEDDIFVSSQHKLQKFSSRGCLKQWVGMNGKEKGQFNDPHGLAIYGNQLYVADRKNH